MFTMNKISATLKIFLGLSLGTFLLLLLINISLPALLSLLRVPSFAIGHDGFWLLRWRNTDQGSGILFNVLPLLAIAIIVGLVGLIIHKPRP
jgi:hypothetical protein